MFYERCLQLLSSVLFSLVWFSIVLLYFVWFSFCLLSYFVTVFYSDLSVNIVRRIHVPEKSHLFNTHRYTNTNTNTDTDRDTRINKASTELSRVLTKAVRRCSMLATPFVQPLFVLKPTITSVASKISQTFNACTIFIAMFHIRRYFFALVTK